jgi:hypothetical protein
MAEEEIMETLPIKEAAAMAIMEAMVVVVAVVATNQTNLSGMVATMATVVVEVVVEATTVNNSNLTFRAISKATISNSSNPANLLGKVAMAEETDMRTKATTMEVVVAVVAKTNRMVTVMESLPMEEVAETNSETTVMEVSAVEIVSEEEVAEAETSRSHGKRNLEAEEATASEEVVAAATVANPMVEVAAAATNSKTISRTTMMTTTTSLPQTLEPIMVAEAL